jgi:mannose-6-phosphate isomerase-like protein (cupin superfamily)
MIKSIENSEHYQWGNLCDGWHLLKSDTLSVIQEKMPAGTFEQLHFHNNSQQLFFLLSGIAHFEIDGKEYVVKANESLHIPKMTKHRISNKSKDELHFLVISEPKSHGDRVNL